MTTSEITYVIRTVLGEPLDMVTPLKSVSNIKITSHEAKYPNVKDLRFKFNTITEMLEIYCVKEYNGKIPSNWIEGKHYDEFGGKKYKYMFDPKTMEPWVDVFDFSSIVCIAPMIS